jgi:hypothetical protein
MHAGNEEAKNGISPNVEPGRATGELKNISIALIFLGIYSTNIYAAGSFSIDPRIENFTTIGFREGQVFTVPSADATVDISPGVSGILSYTWTNTTGKLEFLDLTAHFQTNTAAIGRADLISVPLPSDPVGGPEISHTETAAFNQTFGPPFSFGVGAHNIGVTIIMQPTATPNQSFAIQPVVSFAVQVVPEPETYAMFLAGLGLIGWRMRRSRKYQTIPI